MGHDGHWMILASAGSGKTYRLVNRVIRLVAGGAAPESIIALTFTRKAAGEFADAVLMRLADAVLDPAKAARLREDARTGESGPAGLLENVARALPRWMLGTMDGFFSRVVRAFPYEMGLAGGAFELVEGPRARLLQQRLFERTLTGSGKAEIDEEFINTFRRATMGREEVGVLLPLRRHVDKWQELYLEADGWEWGPALGERDVETWEREKHALAEKVRAGLGSVTYTDRRQEAAMEKLLDSIEAHTIGSGAITDKGGRLFEMLLQDLSSVAEGPMELSLYKPFTLPASMAGSLRELMGLCTRCEVGAAVTRTRAIRRVVETYDSLAERELRAKGLLGFRDVKHLMGRWAHDEDARLRREQVDYRLDARLRHWLLDEFQDTSRSDWRGIAPLVDEVMSSDDGSLFIVGDKKQAIYGWRGGDVSLFDDIHGRYREKIHRQPMADSYRSCPEVLALVNRVCGDVGVIRRLFGAVADRWEWEEHVSAPHLTAPEKAGEALVECVDGWEARQQRTLEILRERGVGSRSMSCGVLLRDNRKAAEMADFLRSGGLDVVLDGVRKPATDSPVGWLVLQTIRWLADPADTFAREVLAMTPAGQAWRQAHGGSWRNAWQALTEDVAELGFSQAVEAWVRPHSDGWSDFGKEAMESLLEAMRSLDRQGATSAREVADWLENLEVAQAPGLAEVQVMTVHKSKGLGFDLVVVPDVPDDKLPNSKYFDIAMSKPDQWILESPPQWVRQVTPELRKAEEEWEQMQRYEAMCLLYVALTRAKRGLIVLLDPPGAKADPAKPSLANWMRCSLPAEQDGILFRSGAPGWTTAFDLLEPEVIVAPGVKLGDAVPKRGKTTASKRLHTRQGVEFGNEVHRLLETVAWADVDPPTLPDTEAGRKVGGLIGEPELGWIFHRSGREVGLFTEQAVDALLDGQHLAGTIDRLLLHREGGSVTRVDIIDWKTDAVDKVEQLVERHQRQMTAYRQAMEQAYPGADVRCHLVSVKHRRAVEVG